MAYTKDITSADCTILVIVEKIFPAGFKLEQFSTDAMAALNEEQVTETRMGVDEQMVAGYVNMIKTVTVTLEPSSPSITNMNVLIDAMRQNKHPYWVTLSINIPALSRTLLFSNGVLKQGKKTGDLQRVQAPLAFQFDFEKVSG